LGMTLAINLPSAESITLTERLEAIDRLAAQCAPFAERMGAGPALNVAALDWRGFLASQLPAASTQLLQEGDFDVVFGTDLVWNEETATSFPAIVRAILLNAQLHGKRDPLVIYGHWNRSMKPIRRFLECCEDLGLVANPFPEDTSGASQDQISDSKPLSTEDSQQDYQPDWTSYIFDDAALPDDPIFHVYKLTLKLCLTVDK